MKAWFSVRCMLTGRRGRDMTLSEAQLKLRQEVLTLLLKNYDDNKAIYECADDWCSKQVTTSGLIKYFEAYYT